MDASSVSHVSSPQSSCPTSPQETAASGLMPAATSIMLSTPSTAKPEPQPRLPEDYRPTTPPPLSAITLPAPPQGTPAKAARVSAQRFPNIQEAYHHRQMRQLEHAFHREHLMRNEHVGIPNMSHTMNPVAKLQANAFVPKTALGSLTFLPRPADPQQSKDAIDNALRSAMTDPSIDENERNTLKADWDNGGRIFKMYKCYVDPKATPADLFSPNPPANPVTNKDMTTQVVKLFDGMAGKAKKYAFDREAYQPYAAFHTKLKEEIAQANQPALPEYFEKEQVLKNLELAKTVPDSNHAAIDAAMEAIQKKAEEHISSKDLKQLVGAALLPNATRNLQALVSTAEATVYLQYNKEVANALKSDRSFQSMDVPHYAVKTGLENNREVVATAINDITGANKFLLPKRPITLQGVSFGDKNNPTVIYAKWLDGEKIVYKDWARYFNYTSAKAKYEQEGIHSDARTKVEATVAEEKAKFEQLASKESVQMQAYNDLDLMSFDSHTEQYVIVDGNAFCYDFSRFLPPCDVINNSITGNTTGMLRSCFLDHPHAETEMIGSLKEMILSQDMNVIEQEIRSRGLIGDPTMFDKAEADLNQCQTDYDLLNAPRPPQDKITELAHRYGVDISSPTVIADTQAAIRDKKLEIQEMTTKYIDPKAFEGWKERRLKEQEYLQQTEHPTLKGMRDHVFPDFVPFYNALERLEGASSQNLGIKMQRGGPVYRSFEGILSDAKDRNFPASEIQEMEAALARMKARAAPGVRLSLSMKL